MSNIQQVTHFVDRLFKLAWVPQNLLCWIALVMPHALPSKHTSICLWWQCHVFSHLFHKGQSVLPTMPSQFPIDIIKYGILASVFLIIWKVQINTIFYTIKHICILPSSIKRCHTHAAEHISPTQSQLQSTLNPHKLILIPPCKIFKKIHWIFQTSYCIQVLLELLLMSAT